MRLQMRKINPRDFSVATRTTSREINRRIVLNLIRERQPILRADLARYMKLTRGVVGRLCWLLIPASRDCRFSRFIGTACRAIIL